MPPQITVFFQRFGAGLKSFTAGQRTLAVLGLPCWWWALWPCPPGSPARP